MRRPEEFRNASKEFRNARLRISDLESPRAVDSFCLFAFPKGLEKRSRQSLRRDVPERSPGTSQRGWQIRNPAIRNPKFSVRSEVTLVAPEIRVVFRPLRTEGLVKELTQPLEQQGGRGMPFAKGPHGFFDE